MPSNTGSLVIEILDLRNITPDNKVKVIWSAYAGDVYSTIDLIKTTEEGHRSVICTISLSQQTMKKLNWPILVVLLAGYG